MLLVERIKLGFAYASIAIRIEVFEGRVTARTMGSAGSFHAFRAGAEFTTGRRALTESTFTAAFGATGRAIAIGFRAEFATGRRALAISAATAFGAALRAVAFRATIKTTTGRRALTVAAAFATELRRRSLTVATTFATEFGRRSLTVATTRATIVWSGKFRASVAATIGSVFGPGAGALLGNDNTCETYQTQRAEATANKGRRPGSGC